MASEVTASLIEINPDSLFLDGYELADQSIIPNEDVVSAFTPNKDIVEYWVYDLNLNLINGVYNFIDYNLVQNPTSEGEIDTSTVELSPVEDAFNLGYETGKLYSVYNFIRYQLSSSSDNKYYLAEISSDRTEIRLKSNTITEEEISTSFGQLKSELNSSEYFDEFYITFGDGSYNIGVNVELDLSGNSSSILIKLYDALPPQYSVKDELYVVTKVAESVGYQIEYPDIVDLPSDVNFLKGPNTNLDIKDFVNNSTELKSKSELVNTNSSASKNNLANVLNREGVTIAPNYSYNTFNEFVNFSSAKKRIENFIEKVEQIQSYESDIEVLGTVTGPTSESFEISSSIASAETNIENIIKNFDGYEYFLYYSTGSSSYPKTGSFFPFTLLDTTDPTVVQWLGSDDESSPNYGGILLSASFYDNKNQNYLYYTIPEFIRDNENNNQYVEFSNMVGQHFDEIWLYTKAVSERNNTTSNLDDGIPLQLADDAISSLGYTGFGNNYNNQDNYIGLTGEDSGSYVPPTGSELITNYIAVNLGGIVNYWSDFYSDAFYVEQLEEPGYPYAIDKVSKEIFKRLYHNMSYLVKKKGTISGLRQLINIWGIPNTILRINEFGGKNKDNSDDYDLWYNRYSYAFSPISTQNYPSASVAFPWMPLERNRIVDSEYIVPDSLQFRFKTTGIPSSSFAGEFYTQSLAVKKSDGDDTSTDFDFGIALFYDEPTTGSYLGAPSSEYEDWGNMRFYISGAAADGGVAVSDNIYLPFYDKGWWSVMLQRDTHVSASDNSNATTYTLHVKNKTYSGWDGNSIGFEGSASIVSNVSTSINEAWNKFGTSSADGIYLGGFISGSNVGGEVIGVPGKMLSGSLQEFRYYSQTLPEEKFNDFVMNPESIEGINLTGSLSSFDILNFRAPLGNEMESMFTSSQTASYTDPMTSMHPAITGSADLLITGSFVNPVGDVTSSIYNVLYYDNTSTKTYSKTNTEVYFLDQPAMGLRNRISNKIQQSIDSSYGNTLSSLTSIEQDYQISRSYTEDISSLEVAFSPQEEVNDDIIATFGYGVVADALADPRFISESTDHYPQLRKTAEDYFQKYTKGNVYDYLRLIKYFDNSIFKAIKNYVPARTNVNTGIVIKQHLLERNRVPQPKLNEVTTIARYASGSGANITYNNPINLENLELTSSLPIGSFEGGAGGTVNKFNKPAGYLKLQDNDALSTYSLTSGSAASTFTNLSESWIGVNDGTFVEVSSSIVQNGYGFIDNTGTFTNITDHEFTGDLKFELYNQGSTARIKAQIEEIGFGVVAETDLITCNTTEVTILRGGGFESFTFKANTSYKINLVSDTNTTVRRFVFGFENGDIPFWTGQVYNNTNTTVVGLLTDRDQREEEFFNGEYSGSDLIATTQSLFDNPFLDLSTTETVYSASVYLTGMSNYSKGGSNPIIDLKIGDPSEATVKSYVQTTMSNPTASVVWITSSIEPGEYLITAIAMAAEDGAGNTFDGLLNSNINPAIPKLGTTLTPDSNYSDYYWGDSFSRASIPYFIFELPENVDGYRPDSESENLSTKFVTSFGLTIDRTVPQPGDEVLNLSGAATRVWVFTGGDDGRSRKIVMGGTANPLTASVYSNDFGIKYIPSNLVVSESFSNANVPTPSAGQINMSFVRSTYYATSSDGLEYLTPAFLRIHDEDNSGNDNLPSFNLNAELKFPLTITGSLRVDGTGVATNIVDTSLLTKVSGYQATPVNNFTFISQALGNVVTGRPNSIVGDNDTSLVLFDPFVDPTSTISFESSDYFATINNYNDNRSNSFIMNVEYEDGISTPSNLSLIKSRTAEKTQTPDSNYTSNRVINPRYNGVRLQSVTYNNYTPPTSSVEFFGGDTGSWDGDVSYGKRSVIDKNPIYFAHFKTSQTQPLLFGTIEFTIDELIQVPFEDIKGTPIEPVSLKIEGDNSYLSEIVSTFEKNRSLSIAYRNNTYKGVNYKSLKTGQFNIQNPGSEYILGSTNQISETQASLTASYNRFSDETLTMTSSASDILMTTGSGCLFLSGSQTPGAYIYFTNENTYTSGTPPFMALGGPYLSVLHTYNYCLKNNIYYDGYGVLPFYPGVSRGINNKNDQNYFRLNPSLSNLGNYNNLEEPFLIERGDEIRATYSKTTINPFTTSASVEYFTQDFTVEGVEIQTITGSDLGTANDYSLGTNEFSNLPGSTSVQVWSKILVTPDPSTLINTIDSGSIYSYTHRKRRNADDKMVVFSNPPSGSNGAQTISKDGFLIPNDLTPTQKKNVATLINQLKLKNAFDDNASDEITPSI